MTLIPRRNPANLRSTFDVIGVHACARCRLVSGVWGWLIGIRRHDSRHKCLHAHVNSWTASARTLHRSYLNAWNWKNRSRNSWLQKRRHTHAHTPLQVQRERINKGQRDKARQMCLSASEREMHQPPQQSTGRFRLRIPIWLLRQSAEVIPPAYKISFFLSSSVSLSVAWKQRRSTH